MNDNQIAPMGILQDEMGRIASYARISITDRCNLGCVYCGAPGKKANIPHERILRYERIIRFLEIARGMGIAKTRITGGEPFARKDCAKFLVALRERFPEMSLCVTTNATMLEPWLDDLAAIRLTSVNISMDSLDPSTYSRLTGGHDLLATVLANINGLLDRGVRVKINAVAIRGVTDIQMSDFVNFAKETPIDMRFIEFMPMGEATAWRESLFISAGELLDHARQHADLTGCGKDGKNSLHAGPARMYGIGGGKGRIGFISALSNHFCHSCNRLRLTCDGKLRTCLFADKEYSLGAMLSSDKVGDSRIASAIRAAHKRKPLGANILAQKKGAAVAMKPMVDIGG